MIFEVNDYAALKRAVESFCGFLRDKQVPEERVFDSRLVVNELIGNILRHSNGKASFQGGIQDGFVEIYIRSTQSTAFIPPEKTALPAEITSEHGRGLFLVDSVSSERIVLKDGVCVKIRIVKTNG